MCVCVCVCVRVCVCVCVCVCVYLAVTPSPSRTCCLGNFSRDTSPWFPGQHKSLRLSPRRPEGGHGVGELLRGDGVAEVKPFGSGEKEEAPKGVPHQEEKPQRRKEGVQEFTDPWLHFDFTSWGSYIVLRSVCVAELGEGRQRRERRLKGPPPQTTSPYSVCPFNLQAFRIEDPRLSALRSFCYSLLSL